jgi:predicted AAA+ superfamily ATPase
MRGRTTDVPAAAVPPSREYLRSPGWQFLYSATKIISAGYIGGDQRQRADPKMKTKTQKLAKRAAVAMRVFRATVPAGNTRATERARLIRLIQKTWIYKAMLNSPESVTLRGVAAPAKVRRLVEHEPAL